MSYNPPMDRSQETRTAASVLARAIPDAACELVYRNPWELLVATILSAQCTDERVNSVTPVLFGRWPGPVELVGAPVEKIEEVIRPTGFFRNKARAIRDAARAVMAEHGGRVPRDVDSLVALPGVGRKTANVVLGEAFGIPAGIAVDTHVRRVARRLGLTVQNDPAKIEEELEAALPKREWVAFSMRMILHGRRVCRARAPRCEGCALEPLCEKVGL